MKKWNCFQSTSYTTKDTNYCYQLTTGLILKVSKPFTFDKSGNSIEGYSGIINGRFASGIQFNSSSIVLYWEEC